MNNQEQDKSVKSIIIFGIIFLIVLSGVITYNTIQLTKAIKEPVRIDYENLTEYVEDYRIIGTSDNNMRNVPISATIKNGTLSIKGELTNNTGRNLTLRDYAIISFGNYNIAGDVVFEGEGKINNGNVLEVTFTAEVSMFRKLTVLPTTIYAKLGSKDDNNGYHEFNLKYTIAWY